MTALSLYFIIKLDAFIELFSIAGLLSFLTTIACTIHYFGSKINPIENFPDLKIPTVLSICIFILSVSLSFVLPSTKEAAAIYFIPKFYNSITENKELQKIPPKLVDLANQWLDELKPKKTDK